MEDSTEGDVSCGGPAQEVSEGKCKWPRDHSWDILAKNVAAFFPCPWQRQRQSQTELGDKSQSGL